MHLETVEEGLKADAFWGSDKGAGIMIEDVNCYSVVKSSNNKNSSQLS